MIRLFSNAVRFFVIALAATVVLTVFFLFGSPNPAFSVFIVIAGVWVSWFGALYIAVGANQKLLAILYNEMRPDEFIERYTPLLSRCRKGSTWEAVLRAHIGNAYAAKGEFNGALEWFTGGSGTPVNLAMQAQDRGGCDLWKGDLPAAEREIAALKGLLPQIRNQHRRMENELACKLLEVRLRFREDGTLNEKDTAFLRQESAVTNKPLHKAALRLELARVYLAQNQMYLARDLLQNIVEDGGDIWCRREAEAILSGLPERRPS